MKYLYSATIKGQDVSSETVVEMAEKINTLFAFPIVTSATLHNYFTRPNVMLKKAFHLDTLSLKRTVKSSV